jgi:hypothetical protein
LDKRGKIDLDNDDIVNEGSDVYKNVYEPKFYYIKTSKPSLEQQAKLKQILKPGKNEIVFQVKN